MRVSVVALLSGALFPFSATAHQNTPGSQQTSPPSAAAGQTADPIIVTGRPLPSKEQIRSITRSISPATPSSDPLARFNDPVCLASVGLDCTTMERIGQRFAADAEQAGLKLAGDHCKPNIVVLFIDGVNSEIDTLVKRKWWIFGDRSPAEIRTIVHERGPVRAWSNSETRGRDGERIDTRGVLRIASASRIVAPIRKDTLAAIVMIERSALIGKTTHQIADYLAMRALAGVRPPQKGDEQNGNGETILGLFTGDAPGVPAEMTALDRGYLRGLYAAPANAFAWSTQGQIVRTILKAKDAEVAPADKP
ncbi:hypothetical protein SAMN03159338_2120 [Sphingomonas sp. NFR04]|uniref:hypothetical protein n=1 Tax=Sphingomonas sp. NFR04 TaxID=1566283 RepID=UPI0008EBD16A|nr:hypothetical protein [Sphingomonas sp. NFR04]SFJ66951.1 hypothetical protein SAMN03159338_2120 [Sphingomonas sp. NFR04]